jgi:hypothetical protein
MLGRRSRGPQRIVEVAHRAGAVGVLRAVLDVAGRLNNLHAVPVGLEFIGHNHGQSGAASRAHFGAVRHDFNRAARLDSEIDGPLPDSVRAGTVGGLLGGKERRGNDERAGREDLFEQFAAGGRNNGDHDFTPADCLIACRMRWYVPHRHMLPCMAESISASVGLGFDCNRAAACMI